MRLLLFRSRRPHGSAPQAAPTSHPVGFWFLFWGEFAERCSFYGMKAILLLYLIDRLDFSKGSASAWINYFKAGCYFLPLLGGYVADNYFGKYRTIVAFSIPYILGHVILGIESVPCVLVALALLAIGAGVTKPNISTLMGMTYDQQRPGQTRLRSDGFAMFYVAINAGSLVSSFALPLIRTRWGYQVAFLFPAVFMAVAFSLFAVGKPCYAVETVRRVRLTPAQRRQRWRVLRRIFGLFALIVFFWSVLEQYDNTWVLFARDQVELNVLGKSLTADQFQVLNPVLVVLLVPVATLFWHWLARRGWQVRPTDKMFIGFVLACFAPVILAIAGFRAEATGRVSALWLVAAYVLVTAGEVCISVTATELAFTAAPATMTGFVTGCWLLTMSCGDVLNGLVTPYYEARLSVLGVTATLSPGIWFALFTVLMVLVTLVFVAAARRFNAA